MWDSKLFSELLNRDDVKNAISQSTELRRTLDFALGMSPVFSDPDFPNNEKEAMKQQARPTFVSQLRAMEIDV